VAETAPEETFMTTRGSKPFSPILQLSDLLRPGPQSRPPVDPAQSVRQAIEVVRKTYEQLQARAIELQKVIRREERAVAEWRRKVRETEEQLLRWRPALAEAETRLDQARRQFADLGEESREAALQSHEAAMNLGEVPLNGHESSVNGYGTDGVAVSPIASTTDGRRQVDRVA
jgi:septal ring factor EnvC (AmiA/AmiB activator)